MRRIFTNPNYEEGEKTYLRAQIARINAATGIVPKGLHRVVADDDGKATREVEDANTEDGEPPKAPSTKQQSDINNWVHHTPSILLQGRTKHADVKVEDDEDPEAVMAREIAKDPWEPRLKPIVDDASTRGGMPAWVLRTYGTEQEQIDPRTGLKT